MRRLVNLLVAIFAAATIQTPAAAPAGLLASQPETLRGLPGLRVVIEGLQPDIVKDGLNQKSIRRAVLAELERAHIPVLKPTQAHQFKPAPPLLYIAISSVRSAVQPVYAASVDVAVTQPAKLDYQPGATVLDAVTWRQRAVEIVGAAQVKTLTQLVTMLVAKLAADWGRAHASQPAG
ncbi:MAG: hypothetical protein KGJ62_03960 [Armatimonadetes bacterium]|nr:hypothetical protein [Armatimonadota bacterium]MDE2207825.1 hypothetical protein [Armatimonadota bacterium]